MTPQSLTLSSAMMALWIAASGPSLLVRFTWKMSTSTLLSRSELELLLVVLVAVCVVGDHLTRLKVDHDLIVFDAGLEDSERLRELDLLIDDLEIREHFGVIILER